MKKKLCMLCIGVILALTFTACSKREEPAREPAAEEDAEQPDNDEGIEGRAATLESPENRPADLSEMEPISVDIYYPDGETLVTASEEIYTLDIGQILELLAAYEVLPEGTSFLTLRTEEEDGMMVLYLDMDTEFATYVQGMDEAEEAAVIGSITNTMLSAFDAEKLILTAGGETVKTEREAYEELRFYESVE